MTISEAEAKYQEMLHKESTPSELATGLAELRERMDKLNIAYYNLCDNDEEPGDLYP